MAGSGINALHLAPRLTHQVAAFIYLGEDTLRLQECLRDTKRAESSLGVCLLLIAMVDAREAVPRRTRGGASWRVGTRYRNSGRTPRLPNALPFEKAKPDNTGLTVAGET